MKNVMALAVLTLGLGAAGSAFAEKFAVIDMQQAATSTNYFKSQRASLDATLKPQIQQQETLAKQITDIQSKAQTQGKTMKEADLAKLEQDYAAKVKLYNENQAKIQQRVQSSLASMEKALTPKIEKIVNDLRQQGGYSMIIDRKAVVTFDPAVDLTSKVTQEVNKVLK